ncbi:MAG: hypothetical protein ABI683_06355 [Ginsengibacter sp.]
MKKLVIATAFFIASQSIVAQELYVSTEPASNMATGSIGFRVLSKLYKMNFNNSYSSYRVEPELMIGTSKKWMIHLAGYGSNMFQKKFKVEGGSLYAKYRFYSQDDVHEHFRLAAYSKVSIIDNPQALEVDRKKLIPDANGGYTEQLYTATYQNNEFDIDGNNSGIVAGLVATKLVNRVAVSGSASYGRRLNNLNNNVKSSQPLNAINYTASFGYLLLPKEYVSYRQTNMNLYAEVLGTSFPGDHMSYIDVAPAVQFIFNSISRLDLSYRFQVAGNTQRLSNNYFMIRLEYNILNLF